MARKIRNVPTATIVEHYGGSFKPIDELQQQLNSLDDSQLAALAALIGEYDSRGQSGYKLTDLFFTWFQTNFDATFSIEGPRGAGRDIELNTLFGQFTGSYPCDFVIRDRGTKTVCAVGFARYDSTRGGAQSDDRTGGNAHKVLKAIEFCQNFGARFRILFVSDGPGLAHADTWREACDLDGQWDGAVRVTTLRTALARVTSTWLLGN